MEFTHEKGALRETITARRRALEEPDWQKNDETRCETLLGQLGTPGVIALYASRKQEPGTLIAIRRLLELGWQVLLPKLSKEPDWAWATGELRPGWAGIPEPTDQGRLPGPGRRDSGALPGGLPRRHAAGHGRWLVRPGPPPPPARNPGVGAGELR